MEKIRVGIVGYGNLGQGVHMGIAQNKDMEVTGVFTRRDPSSLELKIDNTKVFNIKDAKNMTDKIDVMILCGGSLTDIPEQAPELATMFNTVDGYDIHAKIPEYFDQMDAILKKSNKTSVISTGWDPGMFSLNRVLAEAILPEGIEYTFWGPGISQGHSDALRRVEGVKDAKQYTLPKEEVLEMLRQGETPELTASDRHKRECFVVANEGADQALIEKTIKAMPNYFADYETIVHFITEEELINNHQGLPHGGKVIRSGRTGIDGENKEIIEYQISLESNPEFTASVLIAYARAVYRLNKENIIGAKTVFDIAPSYLSMRSNEELRRKFL